MRKGWNEEAKRDLKSHGHNVYVGFNTMFINPDSVELGNRVRIDPFCLITTSLKTKDNVQICSHAVLGGGGASLITLGNWAFVGYGSKLFCGSEDYSGEYGPVNDFWGNNKVHYGDVTFKDYAGIASDVIVMPGVTLPEGCCIGAKSFVYSSKGLEPWCVYVGNPLRLLKKRNKKNVIKLAKDQEFQQYYPVFPDDQKRAIE